MNPDLFIIEFVSVVVGIAYFFTSMYLLSQNHPQKSDPAKLPEVAVLIAMRNEQKSIAACLNSLTIQNYPKHLYQVYALDDCSTDRSVEIAQTIVDKNENFHLLKIQEEKHGLKGKMNVLTQALEKLDQEIILITDADCVVPSSWIRTQVSYFSKDTGMVGGLTSLSPTTATNFTKDNSSLFDKIQALDWLYLQTIAAGSGHSGKPITILGNNFGFRNEAYKQVGGFKKLDFSVTEDFLLMQALLKNTSWKIKHTLDRENMIFSKPVKNLVAFLQQRRRWTSGGRSARPWAYFIVGLSLIAHLLIVAVFALQLWKIAAGLGIGLIIGMDYYILKRATRISGLKGLQKYFILFEIFYMFYLIVFSIWTFLPQKVHWKGRKF